MSPRSSGNASAIQRVDADSPTPLYHQIYLVLLDKILNGIYRKGSRVPSEHEIERSFGVSRITARKALDKLAVEGLVTRQRGRGTIVSSQLSLSSITGEAPGLIEDLLAMAQETDVELLEFEYLCAGPHVANALDIEIDTIVQRAARVRKKNGLAFSYAVTYVPEDIGRKYSETDIQEHPMLVLIEHSGHKVCRATQSISAALADDRIASALGVNVGSALLKVVRVVYDDDERAIEYIIVHYRPDLYQLNLELTRIEGSRANRWAVSQ